MELLCVAEQPKEEKNKKQNHLPLHNPGNRSFTVKQAYRLAPSLLSIELAKMIMFFLPGSMLFFHAPSEPPGNDIIFLGENVV